MGWPLPWGKQQAVEPPRNISPNPFSGWWLVYPSERYEFVNWDDNRNPIFPGKCKIDGNHSPPSSIFHGYPFVNWDNIGIPIGIQLGDFLDAPGDLELTDGAVKLGKSGSNPSLALSFECFVKRRLFGKSIR